MALISTQMVALFENLTQMAVPNATKIQLVNDGIDFLKTFSRKYPKLV